jgi:hypothetical protein
VGGYGQSFLSVYRFQNLFCAPQGREWLLNEQSNDVTFDCRHLHARNDLEAVAPLGPRFPRLQGAPEVIVIRDCDDIEISL